jgi:uncharacterized protein YjbI with pentapeptide repeats
MAAKKTAIPGWTPKCTGKTFLFAGKSWRLPQLTELATSEGGRVVDAVSAKLDYVVVGQARGTPAPVKEAEKLNQKHGTTIEILDESGFFALFAPSRDEAIALLKAGKPGWAKWQGFENCNVPMPDLNDVDLRGLDLSGVCQISFAQVPIDGANFTGAKMLGSYFPPVRRATFDRALLRNSDVGDMEDCSLQHADLSEVSTYGHFVRCDFTGAKLCRLDAHGSDMSDCVFNDADLTDAELTESKFTGIDFTGAKLTQAQLVKAVFKNTKLVRVNLANTDLSGAKLVGCDLTGASLRGALLIGADLTDAIVDGADFEDANIAGAKLQGVDAAKAKGLDPAQPTKALAVGPNIKELNRAAKNSKSLRVGATLDLPDGYVTLDISTSKWGSNCYFTKITEGSNIGKPGPWNVPIGDCMQFFAQRFRDGKLRLDSVKVQATKAALGGKELKRLALAAWCEAFGVPIPTDDELKSQGKAKKQDAAALREELLAELRAGARGVKKWNARKPEERKKAGSFARVDMSQWDLQNADLRGLDLKESMLDGARLGGAQLGGATLTGASLQEASLPKATLDGAKGSDANFAGADLSHANLVWANLKRTSFQKANLSHADLQAADLCGADFTGATFEAAKFAEAKFDESTRFPKGFKLDATMRWVGKGTDPRLPKPKALKAKGPIDADKFLKRVEENSDAAKLAKALAMLKADRFKLYAQVTPEFLVGVVKSQGDPDLVYSCRLNSDGSYACCTQNLNICGGLRGSLCKHLLVLIVGLAKAGDFDLAEVDSWIAASRAQKPALDKETMSETFLRYKGAEAGEVDWRPTETIPEDYYAM